MALSEQLILDTARAFRELDSLQGRLDNLSDIRLDITADTSGLNADLERSRSLVEDTASSFGQVNEQVVLTTSEYRRAVREIDQGADAARAIAVATGEVADEALTAEDALRRVAQTMGISEDEARDLARSVGESTREATNLDADLRQVARSMGLSEDEARQFAAAARQGETATRGVRSQTDQLAASWARVRTFIIGAVAAFGVRGLFRQFRQAIDSSTALGESINAVRVTFDEGAAEIERFAQTAAESAGLAASQAQQLVIPIGALLRNFGFEAEEAGSAAVTLAQRAADLASVFDSEVSEALEALGSALRGESEPLRRFGGNINEARVQAFALAEGLADSVSEIDDSVKVQARFGLILQDTARAQGDFAATADSAANRQRTLAADIENTRAGLGDALLPAFEAILEIAPRFIIDIRAMSESMREMAGSAEEGAGGVITLADTLAGLPRGFGVLGTVIGGVGRATGEAGQAFIDLFAGPLSGQGFGPFIEDFNQGRDAIQGMIDSLEQAAILESFINDLKSGVDPAVAFANAAAQTARSNELTVESFEALARISGATDERLIEATRAMLEQGEAAGFDADEIAVLQGELSRLLIDAPPRREFANFAFGLDQAAIAAAIAAREAAEATEQSERMEEALGALGRISDDTGLSIGFIARNIADFDADLVPLVGNLGVAAIEGEAFARAMAGLVNAVVFDFSDAVDEFDLLISKTNEAGDEVPATVEEMLADLADQANQFARLELATTILEALGFDQLAAELRSQGPEAADAAEAFVADIAGAIEAESLLEEGGVLGDDAIEGLRQALEQGDITPALLDLVGQFTSSQIQNEVLLAAIATGNLFGAELQRALDALDLSVTIPASVALGRLDLLPPGAGGGGAGGATSSATPSSGVVNFEQRITFNDTPTPTTDTQRITNATESAIRNLLR